MQSTSELYNTIISGDIHSFEVKLDIAGTEYGMSDLVSLSTKRAAFDDDGPTLGLAVAGEIDVELYANSEDIPRMAEMKPYYRVINETQQSEWIQKGVYYIDTREKSHGGIISLTGFDSMLKAEKLYPGSSLSWPATDIDVVREIAGFIGITIDSRTTALMTSGYQVQLAPQMTMREMLQYIAAMYGGSFIFSDEGKLLLICVWNLDTTAPENIKSKGSTESIRPAFTSCTGVRFIVSESSSEQTEVFAGDETGYVYEIECPFATQEIADSLLAKMQGLVYRPYTSEKLTVNPAHEIGDAVSFGTEQKAGSKNLVAYPLGANKTTDGITYSYETDGSISLSGASTRASSQSYYSVTLTTSELPADTKQVTIIVETSEDFPSKTENNYVVSFAAFATYAQSGGSSGTVQLLNNISTGGGKKRFYNTITDQRDLASIEISFNHSGAGARTYDDNIKIMVVAGSAVTAWEAPNGATEELLSGIYTYELNYNGACRPSLSAPGEMEIDHEYTSERLSARSFKRVKREVYSEIQLLDDQITLKVNKGEVSSEISLEPEDITISGNRIQISSTNWSITKNGVMTAKSGTIGGWDILETKLQKNDTTSHTGITLDPVNKFFDIHSSQNGVHLDEDELRWYFATNGEETNTVAKIFADLYNYGQNADLVMEISNGDSFKITDGGTTPLFYVDTTYGTVGTNAQFAVRDGLEVLSGDVRIREGLTVYGTKNRAIITKSFGHRLLYAYETAEPYFGDIGSSVIGDNGTVNVPIEKIFGETIDHNGYHVFLQKEGPGDLWIAEKAENYFVVEGTPGLKFSFELKAKQIDHAGKRLEQREIQKQ